MNDELKELEEALESYDHDDIYSALIRIGKGFHYEFKDKVQAFLNHADAALRAAAIRVLAFYWQMEEFKDSAERMSVWDEDEETRSVALMGWAAYYEDTNNKEVMRRLYDTLRNKDEPDMVRLTAYTAMLCVSPLQAPSWPAHIPGIENVDEEADWDLVEQLLRNAE